MSFLDRWWLQLTGRGDEPEPEDPELAGLLSRARALPRSVEPQRDLWSGIENRISGRAAASEPPPWSLGVLFPRPLAASVIALALIATTAISVLWIVQPPAGTTSYAEAAVIAERLRERDGVADVHDNILAILEAHRAELPAQTIAILDENLRSIDRAIAEIHMAFESNPDHHALGFLLAEAYRSEADLLERLEGWLQDTSEVTS